MSSRHMHGLQGTALRHSCVPILLVHREPSCPHRLGFWKEPRALYWVPVPPASCYARVHGVLSAAASSCVACLHLAFMLPVRPRASCAAGYRSIRFGSMGVSVTYPANFRDQCLNCTPCCPLSNKKINHACSVRSVVAGASTASHPCQTTDVNLALSRTCGCRL